MRSLTRRSHTDRRDGRGDQPLGSLRRLPTCSLALTRTDCSGSYGSTRSPSRASRPGFQHQQRCCTGRVRQRRSCVQPARVVTGFGWASQLRPPVRCVTASAAVGDLSFQVRRNPPRERRRTVPFLCGIPVGGIRHGASRRDDNAWPGGRAMRSFRGPDRRQVRAMDRGEAKGHAGLAAMPRRICSPMPRRERCL